MKIELKHLAAYLPYGLKGLAMDGDIYELIGINNEYIVCKNEKYSNIIGQIEQFKPLLIPLSEATTFMSWTDGDYAMTDIPNEHTSADTMQYDTFIMYVERHFDVFGLIDAGLAINKNNID